MTPKTLRRAHLGFTLVEAMAALAVSGVLAAVGVPQLTGLLGGKAADTSITGLATAIRLARSEAMKRGEEVTVCARAPLSDDQDAVCTLSGKDWSAGWIVFVDRGHRGQLDEGDVLVSVHQADWNTTKVQATLRYITFESTGISLTAASHFDFLPHGQLSAYGARRVCVNKPGRLRRLESVMQCSA